MKMIRFAGVLVALLALVLGVGTLTASAVNVADSGPDSAVYIDNQPHTIPANSAAWFRFNYSGDESLVSLTLVNLAKTNVIFEVYTPGQVSQWWKVGPVGQATDRGDNHFWLGSSIEGGMYYVRVVNTEPSAMTYTLLVAGAGIATQPTVVIPPVIPVTGIAPTNSVPGGAAYLTTATYSIPANTSLWYRFAFASDDSQVNLKLVNGNKNGLQFEVYGWDQIGFWSKTDPAGRGNVSGDNLVWSGEGDAWAPFYVRIVNNTNSAVSYDFAINGARAPF